MGIEYIHIDGRDTATLHIRKDRFTIFVYRDVNPDKPETHIFPNLNDAKEWLEYAGFFPANM